MLVGGGGGGGVRWGVERVEDNSLLSKKQKREVLTA
jgi:hypothetical protein